MAKRATKTEISEAKIRQVIWMRKAGKTKKACCLHLEIPYNTKKLDSIIEDFYAREEREKELKARAKTKVFSQAEKEGIARAYLNGETQSAIAKQWYISAARVKKFLIEMNVPLRGRGKKSGAQVDHVVQDLETRFQKNEKVFIAKFNCFGIIKQIYDEEYLSYLEEGRQRYVEIKQFKPDKYGLAGNYVDPTEGVHYETYWVLPDGKEMKLRSVKNLRNNIINTLEKTGREFYSVWREDDNGGFYYLRRDQLYPVKAA